MNYYNTNGGNNLICYIIKNNLWLFCGRNNSIIFKMFEAILAERDLFLLNRYCCLVSTFAEKTEPLLTS